MRKKKPKSEYVVRIGKGDITRGASESVWYEVIVNGVKMGCQK